jgi:hypothetical protein
MIGKILDAGRWPLARLRLVGDYAPEGRAYASERCWIKLKRALHIF